MELDECRYCGHEVHPHAKQCPNCGGKTRYADRVEDDRIQIIVVGIFIAMAVVCFLGWVGSN